VTEYYRVTPSGGNPEVYQSLWGAADVWLEFKMNAVVEQVSESGELIREVSFAELRRNVDLRRAESRD